MKHVTRLGILLIALSSLGGCATLHRKAHFTRSGAADPVADQEVNARYKASVKEEKSSDADSVVVMIDTLPAGVDMKDGVLTIEQGYEHEVIGKFELGPDAGALFPNYRDGWRRGMCYPQQVLVLATLFIWTIVPTYYPCFATMSVSKADLVGYLKKLGSAAGGDLVIASYAWHDAESAASATGFILRADPRTTEAGAKEETEEEADETADPEAPAAEGAAEE